MEKKNINTTNEEPNKETYIVIEESLDEDNLNGPFDSIEELMEALND